VAVLVLVMGNVEGLYDNLPKTIHFHMGSWITQQSRAWESNPYVSPHTLEGGITHPLFSGALDNKGYFIAPPLLAHFAHLLGTSLCITYLILRRL
jgi:hypothetical protein